MVDTRTPEQRRKIMQAVKAKNTAPEWVVRRWLHSRGYRYRLHYKGLPGRPDIVMPRRMIAIFVHGCFWHSHSCKKGGPPKSGLDYWLPKLQTNVTRDADVRAKIRSIGWTVLTIWECETRDETIIESKLTEALSLPMPTSRAHLSRTRL